MDGKKAKEGAVLLCDVTCVVTFYSNLPKQQACTDNISARRVSFRFVRHCVRGVRACVRTPLLDECATSLTMNETLSA